jgi:hypothetical protein
VILKAEGGRKLRPPVGERHEMDGQTSLVPVERIERAILSIRGEKVMLDSDLAELYGVETKRLNEQVRRNLARFPADFMLQLTAQEWESFRSQFATLKRGEHRKYLHKSIEVLEFIETQVRPN